MKHLSFTLCILLASTMLFAQSIFLKKSEYAIRLPEGIVHFTIDTTQMVVKFTDIASESDIANFVNNSKTIMQYAKSNILNSPDVVIFNINKGEGDPNYFELLKTTQADKRVEYTAPVLLSERKTQQALYNMFFVKLKSKEGSIVLEQYSIKLGFKILKEYEKDLFFCIVNKNSFGNSFEISKFLQNTNAFEFVEPDFIYTNQIETNDTYYSSQWAINNTGQFSGTSGADMDMVNAWSISTGSASISVAVLDCFGSTSQFTHPDITFSQTFDATGTGFNSNGFNGEAHGIACAGIIRATANNSAGIAGIAYSCNVKAVKIGTINNNNGGWYATGNSIADGITWAYQNADVISNSNSFGSSSSLINTAIANALTLGRNGKGTPFFSSSGNDNTTTIGYPSSNVNTIAVGASSMCDQRKSPTSCDGENWGSNYGTGLDIMAPGVHIYTTDITGSAGYSSSSYYEYFNGTSAACPMAAGVMALILSVDPNLTATEARIILEENCEKVGGYSYTNGVSGQPNGSWTSQMGYGRVNAYYALQAISTNTVLCGNDDCNGAVMLTSYPSCENTYCSVENATPDYFSVPTCDNYSPPANILGAGVFFQFEAVSSTHTITVDPTGTLDAVIVVYSGGCYNLTQVPGGCKDSIGGNGLTTILNVSNLIPGTIYTIRVYDYGNANATSGGFNICVTHSGGSSGDDFYVQNQTVTPTSVAAGGTIDVNASQCYSGTTPDANMGSVYLGYYLSPTPTFNSSTAIYLDEDPSGLGSDDPCNTESETLTVPTGTTSGTYYLLFFADHDNAFVETNENNNVAYVQITITGGSSGDDFYVQNQTVTPTSVTAGGTVDVNASQCYSGTTPDADMGSVYLGYYLSPTPTFNSSTAIYLDEDPSGLGSDDPCNTESETLTIPTGTTSGTYYLLFFTDHDNAFVETNENNNVAYVQITITGGSSGDDFYVQNQTVTPSSVAAGETIDVNASQCYLGSTPDADMGSVYLGYYLSPTPTFNSSTAIYLDEDPSGLGSDDPCNTESETLTIPTGTTSGTYYLLFFADHDNAFVETNEYNNVAYMQITITGGSSGGCTECPSFDYDLSCSEDWQTHESEIVSAGCKLYRFIVENGATYSFKTGCDDGASASFDTYLTLLDQNCNEITYDDDACEENRSKIEWLSDQQDGTPVFLEVTGFSNAAGSFTLAYKKESEQSFNVTVTSNPLNGGNVTGGGYYTVGSIVVVNAYANNGYSFTNWTENGSVVSTNASYSFTLLANTVLVANFTLQGVQYTITANANPNIGGYTTGGGLYYSGSLATVDAITNSGWVFFNWTEYGSQVSTNPSYSFTVNGNRALTANFQQQFTIIASVSPPNTGYTSGGGIYTSGQMATLQATANPGYAFYRWMENGNVVSSNTIYSFTVTNNRTLVASFLSTVGIDEHDIQGIKIYPNPVNDIITLEFKQGYDYKVESIELINSSGQSLKKMKANQVSGKIFIDVSQFADGLYILKLKMQNGTYVTYRVVVKNK